VGAHRALVGGISGSSSFNAGTLVVGFDVWYVGEEQHHMRYQVNVAFSWPTVLNVTIQGAIVSAVIALGASDRHLIAAGFNSMSSDDVICPDYHRGLL